MGRSWTGLESDESDERVFGIGDPGGRLSCGSATNRSTDCFVQAWGARFSDHPLVLGISSSNSPSSSLFPKREREENVYRNISSPHVHTHRLPHPTSHAHGNQDDAQLPTLASLRSDPNRGDLTQMGNRREAFARGMLGRALDKMDQNGAWRTPSAAGCAALLLVEFLVTCECRAPPSTRVQVNNTDIARGQGLIRSANQPAVAPT